MTTPAANPIMLDLHTVASTLSVSETTVKKLVRIGQFPRPRKIAGRVAWLVSEVTAWAHALPTSDNLPPPNTGALKPRPRNLPVGH